VLTLRKLEPAQAEDVDMCGPICVALLLGGLMMLNGKIHFGYIYGFSVIGTVAIYCIMNFLA
jgi:hypothetical protein